jgi:hypothetical protein
MEIQRIHVRSLLFALGMLLLAACGTTQQTSVPAPTVASSAPTAAAAPTAMSSMPAMGHGRQLYAFLVIVSPSLRGFAAIMFGIIADDNQVEDDQTTELIGKGSNLIRFGAKLPKEAFEQIG